MKLLKALCSLWSTTTIASEMPTAIKIIDILCLLINCWRSNLKNVPFKFTWRLCSLVLICFVIYLVDKLDSRGALCTSCRFSWKCNLSKTQPGIIKWLISFPFFCGVLFLKSFHGLVSIFLSIYFSVLIVDHFSPINMSHMQNRSNWFKLQYCNYIFLFFGHSILVTVYRISYPYHVDVLD